MINSTLQELKRKKNNCLYAYINLCKHYRKTRSGLHGLMKDYLQMKGKLGGGEKKSRADSGQLVTCPVFPLLLCLAQWPHAEKTAFGKRCVWESLPTFRTALER